MAVPLQAASAASLSCSWARKAEVYRPVRFESPDPQLVRARAHARLVTCNSEWLIGAELGKWQYHCKLPLQLL